MATLAPADRAAQPPPPTAAPAPARRQRLQLRDLDRRAVAGAAGFAVGSITPVASIRRPTYFSSPSPTSSTVTLVVSSVTRYRPSFFSSRPSHLRGAPPPPPAAGQTPRSCPPPRSPPEVPLTSSLAPGPFSAGINTRVVLVESHPGRRSGSGGVPPAGRVRQSNNWSCFPTRRHPAPESSRSRCTSPQDSAARFRRTPAFKRRSEPTRAVSIVIPSSTVALLQTSELYTRKRPWAIAKPIAGFSTAPSVRPSDQYQ